MTNEQNTYLERGRALREHVARYRIMRHEELPEAHKAQYRINGIDPDTNWSLIWSFDDVADAQDQLIECNTYKGSFQTYKIVDAGAESFIERSSWF